MLGRGSCRNIPEDQAQRLDVWKSRCTLDELMPKRLLQLREQFMTFILSLSAHLHRAGQRAALGWGPKHSSLSIIAHGAPCPGAGVEGALVGSLT